MIRNTRQRTAIREAIESTGRPMSPEEILAAAQQRASGLGAATVYRNIKNLLEEGWLVSVELPGQPQRYELAGKDHHHHFHCQACGQIFELQGCVDGFRQLLPRGFRVPGHQLLLYGECRDCRAERR